MEAVFVVLCENKRERTGCPKCSEKEEMKPDTLNNAECTQTPAGIIEKRESASKSAGTNFTNR